MTDTITNPTPRPIPKTPTAFELSIAPVPLSDDQLYALRFHLFGLFPANTSHLALNLVEQLFRHQQALRPVERAHAQTDAPAHLSTTS